MSLTVPSSVKWLLLLLKIFDSSIFIPKLLSNILLLLKIFILFWGLLSIMLFISFFSWLFCREFSLLLWIILLLGISLSSPLNILLLWLWSILLFFSLILFFEKIDEWILFDVLVSILFSFKILLLLILLFLLLRIKELSPNELLSLASILLSSFSEPKIDL